MRIAVVANTAWYLFNFRLNLMEALVRAGHSVLAVGPDDSYAERIRAAGIRFAAVDISGGGTNPLVEARAVAGLWRLIRDHDVDLLLTYTPKGNLYSALAAIARGVDFVPNVSGLGRVFVRRSPATMVAMMLYRLTFRRARRVFFQNVDDMQIFVGAKLVEPTRAERLPGSGVDLERFVPAALVDRPADEPVFLLVARMLWDKGVGEFVAAARMVRKRFPRARFQLLGFLDVANPSAISREQMQAWQEERVVEYLGKSDDVQSWLAQSDCVVLPSNYREGVPRSLLEAAASARPVITTDTPGCRDTVIDGASGFLCKAADSGDLAQKMLAFIGLSHGQRRTMGLRGRSLVESAFDERIVLERYLELAAEIAARSPA